ncbi:MAG TPA: phage tail tube protein [Aggregatilinea sp.]|uniref:phage tail tube protein n=1 Tax=Aggregatilinea sp. TaxID=2806333 RepID=UPI002B7A19FC|nr:phage tail tube protein [Aggregatilinea sp.]HML23519.1 phage tail tube protein [Aggregatilinea sp.]
MAQTQTAISAVDCIIQLDNASGVLTDISGSSNKVSLSFENGVWEFRPFGNVWKARGVTGKDADASLDAAYTTADGEALALLRDWFFGGDDSPRTLQVNIPDNTPGSDRYQGEFVLETFPLDLDAGADDVVMVSCTLKPNGEVTHEVITT